MKIAVLASGRGSNLQSLLNAIREGVLPASICAVVSNNSSAGALEIARSEKIPALHLSHKQFPSEEAFSKQLLSVLSDHGAALVALAGYMKLVPKAVVERYRNRMTNIHPALLPSFGGPGMYGMRVHEAVIASGAKFSGATVHLVDEEYDRGAILLQRSVEIMPGENPETLAAKVLKIEHEIYPLVLKAFAENRVEIKGRRAWIR
jgi:phosphoribosylglycinamide formyltransferase-1